MGFGLLLKDLKGLEDSLNDEKSTRKFLKKESNKLKRKVISQANQKVKKVTGNYLKGIKSGKPYEYNKSNAVRVYNSSSHSHLIEYGHVVYAKGNKSTGRKKKPIGFKSGYNIFQESAINFESQYYLDVEKFLTENLKKNKF